ncbi:MAG TPA: alkaline phosphatase, partial [Opitutaceae bacterium]|nr:alkaline phosphatase [Opitutaceae bacterium]
MQNNQPPTILGRIVAIVASALVLSSALQANPKISRLTPPSDLFSYGDPNPPIIARFLPGQRFDFQSTIQPDSGQVIAGVAFYV